VIASLPRPGGAFAEYVSLPSDDCAQAPTRIAAAEAAGLPLTGLTCWQALVEKAAVEEGQVLFILSGAGGTGSLAIQIAKHLGAHVLTTCRKENESYVRSLGADEILAYDACDPVTEIKRRYPNGIDCVFSNLLGEMHKRSYALLRKGGVIVTIGEPMEPLLAANAGVREIDLVVRPNGKQLEQIAKLVEDGVIRPPRTTEFRLDEAVKAFRLSMEGHVRGKIVFSVNQGLERTPA
jgi:NADPH:quinone reductase-like Zn-dependent oxidoreductase